MELESQVLDTGCFWGARHTVALLAWVGIFLDYMLQSILAVTVVAMVGKDMIREEGQGDVCPLPTAQNITEQITVRMYVQYSHGLISLTSKQNITLTPLVVVILFSVVFFVLLSLNFVGLLGGLRRSEERRKS